MCPNEHNTAEAVQRLCLFRFSPPPNRCTNNHYFISYIILSIGSSWLASLRNIVLEQQIRSEVVQWLGRGSRGQSNGY